MSNALVAHVSKIKAGSPCKKLLLLVLADNSSDGLITVLNPNAVADRCECTAGEVIVYMAEFRKRGLLAMVNRSSEGSRLGDAYIIVDQYMGPGHLTNVIHRSMVPGIHASLVPFDWGNGVIESDRGVEFNSVEIK